MLSACVVAADEPLIDKTLVVWAAPANLTQQGGTALTIDANGIDRFDGIIFGELKQKVWMPGSNGFNRTEKNQGDWPQETAGPDQFVQIAIVYRGRQVTIYRNGDLYAQYTMPGEPYSFGSQSVVMFGPRHLHNQTDRFVGRIKDARVYAQPLDQPTIAAMEPGKLTDETMPWAWWHFGETGTYERTGRFNEVRLSGDATVEDGCLVLGEDQAGMIASSNTADPSETAGVPQNWTIDTPVPPEVLQSARLLRERFLDDPYRPGYHFCVPEDMGRPGDPNGCFYANGRYQPHVPLQPQQRGLLLGAPVECRSRSLAASSRQHRPRQRRRRLLQRRRLPRRRWNRLPLLLDALG